MTAIALCCDTRLDMTVSTLTMKGVPDAWDSGVNAMALATTDGLKAHMVAIGTVIHRDQMVLMMKEDLSLRVR